jgi:hypothetical protein
VNVKPPNKRDDYTIGQQLWDDVKKVLLFCAFVAGSLIALVCFWGWVFNGF